MNPRDPLKILLTACSLLIVVALFPSSASAGPLPASPTPEQRFVLQDANGLMVTLPQMDDHRIAAILQQRRDTLKLQVEALTAAQKSTRFSTKDAVITAIIPGGLLYAAYRTQQSQRLNTKLAKITRRLEEVSVELLTFDRLSSPQQIAALH